MARMYARRSRPSVKLEQRRMRAHALMIEGYSNAAVAQRLGVSPAAVSYWRRAISQGGPAALRSVPRGGRPIRLPTGAVAQLRWLRSPEGLQYGFSGNLSTVPRILRFVESQWGVRYTRSGMWRLLRRNDLLARRVDLVP